MDESTLYVIMGMVFMFVCTLCCCGSSKAKSEEDKKQADPEAAKTETKQAQG